MNSPMTMSRQIAAHSITKMCDTAVYPRAEVSRRQNEPSPVWVRPRSARWKACECALVSPGSVSPATR